MDFNDTAEEAKFRKEASDWLSANAEKKEHSRDVYRPAEMVVNLAPFRMLKIG
jgi:hypothetical protein